MLTVAQFIERCRERGMNVTYQRILIYKALRKSDNHPTAEEVFSIVKKEYPAISLATVYKTLEIFAEHKIISKVTQLHDLARFDRNTAPHHHLVCMHCRKIIDVHEPDLNRLSLPEQNGFKISGYRIQFEGICPDCDALEQIRLAEEEEASKAVTFCGKYKNAEQP